MTQTVSFKNTCASDLKKLISLNNWRKIFLVTGKNSYESSGAHNFIEECVSENSVIIKRFYEFDANPNLYDLRKGLDTINAFKPDSVIAIGGGSVIDMGKLIRFFYTHEGIILSGSYSSLDKFIPLIAIPTTAGTGSEATHFAVLYDEEKKKHSIASYDILPEYVIINPKLTYGQSKYITACSGFDALAQAIEAYWNKNATKESDEYAQMAINLIFDTLPKVVANPTPELRNKMADGAYWAGKAINITKTTAPHAFSYPFTAHYGIPHGHAVGIVFPAIAEYNLKNAYIPKEKKEFLTNILNLSQNFRSYLAKIGLTIPFKDYNFKIILDEINTERLENNPAKIDICEAKRILNNTFNKNHLDL